MDNFTPMKNCPVGCKVTLNGCWGINPLFLENPLMITFANSEDLDEMQHNAAFHRGLHCL